MRSRFDEQLTLLNKEMIEMGALCEEIINTVLKALAEKDEQLLNRISSLGPEIDQKERTIETLCLKLLLQQQPVATDLRQISAALKMITDMERIGDQAEDIAEMAPFVTNRQELALTVAAVEDGGIRYLEKMKSDRPRITWIDKDGTVLYDTVTGKKNKENHLEREEVKSAFKTGEGMSNRYSNTLFEKTIYYAKRMEDGTVLRISISSATVGLLFLGMLQPILIVVVFALVLSGMLASRLSKRIVQPLNDLDLEEPLDNDTYEEISPLLNRINRQKNEIQRQFKELQQREAEFTQITACMNEGLVLMDKKGTILNINPAANNIFSLNEDGEGKDFLAIYRDHEMSLCMKAAAESGHSEIQQSRFGREYQFDVSRIESEGEVCCIGK